MNQLYEYQWQGVICAAQGSSIHEALETRWAPHPNPEISMPSPQPANIPPCPPEWEPCPGPIGTWHPVGIGAPLANPQLGGPLKPTLWRRCIRHATKDIPIELAQVRDALVYLDSTREMLEYALGALLPRESSS